MARDPLDPQRDAVYRAQDEAFKSEHGADDLSLRELQAFADTMTGTGWWRQRYRRRKIPVGDGRGSDGARAGADGRSTQHPGGTRSKYLVTHEAAHIVDPTKTEDHGAVFCGLFLFMVGKAYSRNAKRRLASAFRRHGVVWDRKVAACGKP